jgi:hypothetical protein
MNQFDVKRKQNSKREPWNPLLISYPESEKINNISPLAETFYTRLIAKCDDNANFFGDVSLLLSYLYAIRWKKKQISKRKVAKLLKELVDVGLVYTYEVRGEYYLHILRCKKHLRSDINRDIRFPEHPTPDCDVSANISDNVPPTVHQARDAPTYSNTNTDTNTDTLRISSGNSDQISEIIEVWFTAKGRPNILTVPPQQSAEAYEVAEKYCLDPGKGHNWCLAAIKDCGLKATTLKQCFFLYSKASDQDSSAQEKQQKDLEWENEIKRTKKQIAQMQGNPF